MSERMCTKCIQTSVAAVWNGDLCPRCGFQNGEKQAVVHSSTSISSVKPSIILTLSSLGWILFAMTGLAGLFLMAQNGGGIFGASLIIAGVFQLCIFLGFSAIIDQLHQINMNTSTSDEDE